jgi:hypothetical protein
MTQITVAKALGISQGALSKLENGTLMPSTTNWYMFCELAKIPPDLSWRTGCVDLGTQVSYGSNDREGGFRIPERYARHQGSKVRTALPFLQYFRSRLGPRKLEAYLNRTGVDPDYFVVLDNQLNIEFTLDMARHLISAGCLKPKDVSALAAGVKDPCMHGRLAAEYDGARDYFGLAWSLSNHLTKYEINSRYEFDVKRADHVDIRVTPEPHLRQFAYRDDTLRDFVCRYKKHAFQAFLSRGNRQTVDLEERQCHFTGGADSCVYRIRAA